MRAWLSSGAPSDGALARALSATESTWHDVRQLVDLGPTGVGDLRELPRLYLLRRAEALGEGAQDGDAVVPVHGVEARDVARDDPT